MAPRFALSLCVVSDDEDDWVGTPPEGRHSRDRADPEFWRRKQWQAGIPLTIYPDDLAMAKPLWPKKQ